MVRRLKYKIVDADNHIVHHSYNKKKANKWIKEIGNKNETYHIEKLECFSER